MMLRYRALETELNKVLDVAVCCTQVQTLVPALPVVQLFMQQSFNAKGSRASVSGIKPNMVGSCLAVGHHHCRQ